MVKIGVTSKKSGNPAQVFLYNTKVQAGFPSPADDYIEKSLDLNTHLVSRPASTFFASVNGDSMIDACIRQNDLLIVDKSIKPINGKIVIAVVDGEFTVKRLKINKKNEYYLFPENKNYNSIKMGEESYIWGVVTTVIQRL